MFNVSLLQALICKKVFFSAKSLNLRDKPQQDKISPGTNRRRRIYTNLFKTPGQATARERQNRHEYDEENVEGIRDVGVEGAAPVSPGGGENCLSGCTL